MQAWSARLDRWGRALGLGATPWGLARTGLALALLYGLYALAFPEREARALRHVFGWGGSVLFLLLWLRGAQQVTRLEARAAVPWRLLWAFFALFVALAAAVRPFHSSDLYAYVTVGRLQAHYDLNPYVHTGADVPGGEDDALLSGTWRDVPCTYGFLSALTCRAVAEAGGGDLERTLWLFKLLGALVLACIAHVTVAALRAREASTAGFALFTLLWSPYVLLHFVSNGHNDLWMALCILLALRTAAEGRWWAVVPAVVAGALFKHIALALLPFACILLVRRHGWRRMLLSTVAAVPLAAAAAWPYLDGLGAARWGQIGSMLTTPWNSFQAVLTYGYGQIAAWIPALEGSAAGLTTGVRVAFGAAYLAFYARCGLRALRRRDYDAPALVSDSAWVLFVLLCVASAAWHPWYLGMILPAVLLLPREHPVRGLTLWIAAFQMLAFTPLAKARMLEALVTLALPMLLWWRVQRTRRDPQNEKIPRPGR